MFGKRFIAHISLALAASLVVPRGAGAAAVTRVDDPNRVNVAAAQRSFFLPGLGQWYKGYEWKGAGIGGLEALMLGGSIYTFSRARQADQAYRRGEAPYSRYTRKVDHANFLLLGAGVVWFFAVADAYVSPPAWSVTTKADAGGTVQLAYSVRF